MRLPVQAQEPGAQELGGDKGVRRITHLLIQSGVPETLATLILEVRKLRSRQLVQAQRSSDQDGHLPWAQVHKSQGAGTPSLDSDQPQGGGLPRSNGLPRRCVADRIHFATPC
jgi:hypothetical protein